MVMCFLCCVDCMLCVYRLFVWLCVDFFWSLARRFVVFGSSSISRSRNLSLILSFFSKMFRVLVMMWWILCFLFWVRILVWMVVVVRLLMLRSAASSDSSSAIFVSAVFVDVAVMRGEIMFIKNLSWVIVGFGVNEKGIGLRILVFLLLMMVLRGISNSRFMFLIAAFSMGMRAKCFKYLFLFFVLIVEVILF